jgi:hypothetical protein
VPFDRESIVYRQILPRFFAAHTSRACMPLGSNQSYSSIGMLSQSSLCGYLDDARVK